MGDWEEIKRLAADFQKVQLSTKTQKLTERNCIEIITLLKEKKIIDLLFTADGKEFLTPSQLVQDIKNELEISGGRIELVELSKIIGVDLTHIENTVKEILRKGQKDIHSILGQLIDTTYITKIACEINERLSQQGQININDLTVQYDLPSEFLQQEVVEKHLEKLIFGKQGSSDPKVFFTESFMARCKAKIEGALIGLTKPTPVASILNHINVNEKLFFSLFDQACTYGVLTNRVVGSQYIPNIYARSQNDWVKKFYRQNGYLEFDAFTRLGITDYKSYIKKQFASEEMTILSSCAVSRRILDTIEASIEECISSKSYLDIQSAMPSVFNEKDITLILDSMLTKQNKQVVMIENYLFSSAFIENLCKNFDELIQEKAKEAVESGRFQQHQTDLQVMSNKSQKFEEVESKTDKREERRKKANSGKTGGGTQGRETKTKAAKKSKGAKGDVEESVTTIVAEKKQPLNVVTSDDIKIVMWNELEKDGIDELTIPLTQYVLPKLNDKGLTLAADLYTATVANHSTKMRQTHNELQVKLNAMIGDVRLFEKGTKLLSEDLQSQLVKYLLKSLCTDIVTEILSYVAVEHNTTLPASATVEQKLKFVNNLTPDLKKSLLPAVQSLQGQSIDEFMVAIESALGACSMIIKKIDKKKDKSTVLNHKHTLIDELNKCDDVALVLHLAVLIIFMKATHCMLHASGKHVVAILTYLKQYLSEEQKAELTSYQEFVTLMLGGGSEAENAKEKLKEKITSIKKIVEDFKKSDMEKS